MRAKKRSIDELEAELEVLPDLPRPALKKRWQELYGTPCPPKMSRKLLRYAIAYRLQEKVYGGLDKKTLRLLEKAAANLAAGKPVVPQGPKIRPGTRLLREWHGTMHEAIVLEEGVQFREAIWPSLTAVARAITGTHWSGPRFFGLKERS